MLNHGSTVRRALAASALVWTGGSCARAPSASASRIALAHITVIDVVTGTERADQSLVIEGDRIVAVVAGPPPTAPPTRVVDMRGKYAIPGLWDMHVHFMDPAQGRLFVANGVTGVRVMWGNPRIAPGMERFHFEMRDAFDQKREVGPRMIVGSQIVDGPVPVWPASVAVSNPEEARNAVVDAKKSGVDFLKVYSRLPRDAFFAIAEESKKQGLPFEGHVPDAVAVAEASDAGQKSIEHSTGVLFACSSRETEL
jgi:hypothetical protein